MRGAALGVACSAASEAAAGEVAAATAAELDVAGPASSSPAADVRAAAATGHSFPATTDSRNPAYCAATLFQLHSRATQSRARSPRAFATSCRDTSKFKYSKMRSS